MIQFDDVTITYPDSATPALRNVDLVVPEGELCLVVGPTGVGKSTLLGAVNGLVPHFTGGHLRGRVTVDGLDTRNHPPRDLADVVGVVVQDPINGFVTEMVEDELAYSMEQLAVDPATMRKRVEETLDLLGIHDLRHRPIRSLSGGQQQRVAIGAALTAHPKVLVLDEPTSALDPSAAEDVLAALLRLVHDLGTTVLVAEHRLERVVEYADLVVSVASDRTVTAGPPAAMMATTTIAPPVVRLGRLAGWEPMPLSVRDARRRAPALRAALDAAPPPARRGPTPLGGRRLVDARGVAVRYGSFVAVAGVDVTVDAGEVVGLMGRNGSGKSSLLWALHGTNKRAGGTIALAGGTDPADLTPDERLDQVALVPQTPSDLLFRPTVADECAAADDVAGAPSGRCADVLERLAPGIAPESHPRDLSEGQRLALVLALQLTPRPPLLLLDEPTRGLDETAKTRLIALLRERAADGTGIVVATHDVEFIAQAADRVVVMADGEIVADGATAEVVVSSPVFAPQVAKILRPGPWLTVDQVRDALEANDAR